MNQNSKIFIALTLYLTSLFASNTLGLKLMPFIFGTHLSAAIFFFPFVFITTDVIGEVFGKKMARGFVLEGLLSVLLFLAYNILSIYLPWSTEGEWLKSSYETVFGISIRISLASILAYVIAEYQDVISFFFFKRKMHGGKFWFSSNLSNMWSQMLDSYIFMFVAFWGIYSLKVILLSGLTWWIYKVVMGALYTPLSYAYIYWLKKDQNDSQSN